MSESIPDAVPDGVPDGAVAADWPCCIREDSTN